MLGDLGTFLHAVVCLAAATVAGLLPRRYWSRLEAHVPVSRAALVSAIATVALAGVIGMPAFLRYSHASAERAADAMLQSTGWRLPSPGAQAPSDSGALVTWLTSYAAFFSFAFLTPVGLLCTYLAFSGVLRAVSVAADEPRGDPLLEAADAVGRRYWSDRGARRARFARERLEGPHVPDRLIPGPAVGLPEADCVVVSSRQKPGWTAGTFIITGETWYRLGTPVERQTPVGLRTLYPLTELRDREVLRRGIRYELPALSGPFSKTE